MRCRSQSNLYIPIHLNIWMILYNYSKSQRTNLACFWSKDLRTDWVGWAVKTRSTVWFFRASKISSGDLFSSPTSLLNVSSMSDSVVAEFSSAKSPFFNFLILRRWAIWSSSAKLAKLSMWEKALAMTMESPGSRLVKTFPSSLNLLGSFFPSYSAASS